MTGEQIKQAQESRDKRKPERQYKHPLILAHVCLYKGDVLIVCDANGHEHNVGNGYTVSHWDDTWLYYDNGKKGEIGWLYYRIIEEGKKPINSDPAMFKQRKEQHE